MVLKEKEKVLDARDKDPPKLNLTDNPVGIFTNWESQDQFFWLFRVPSSPTKIKAKMKKESQWHNIAAF